MKPIVNGLKKAHIGRIKVVRIDREDPENIEIVQQYGARNQPMYFMLDSEGEIIWQWIGASFCTLCPLSNSISNLPAQLLAKLAGMVDNWSFNLLKLKEKQRE